MRLIVILNPTNKRGTKAVYSKFRKRLISDGFLLWGQEIFIRIVANRKNAETHVRRLREEHPDTGTIRILQLTEKQFSSIISLTGTVDMQEQTVGTNEIIML